MCFEQDEANLLNDKPLKLVDHFTYLSGNISSSESSITKCIGNAWMAIDRLETILKSNLSGKNKTFFQAVVMSVLFCNCTNWTLAKLEGNYTMMLRF